MSTVENYQKAKCAQVNLDDGNKVLISYGATDMRVLKVGGWFSVEKNVLHIFRSEFLMNLNIRIGYDISKDVVKILADELAKNQSIEELKSACLKVEESEEFLQNI
ncbi:MAG: hypothetical protein KBD26_02580 [Candidatus Pacebacteria bacterium]|nr:hypothetical protein [Candidatus Paceibacterota bacterium]MBP9772698.1 hypothetical protein [Candidatus Paceibacterota bacterium]